MNIFILGTTPESSARAHCDQHLHKMVLESAQIISTALHLRGWKQAWMYKPTHISHPCVQWAASSNHNILWVIELADELRRIREELDCPPHASSEVIKFAQDYLAGEVPFASSYLATDFALAMPLHIHARSDIDTVGKYQAYYRWKNEQWKALDKGPMTWKNRPVPEFMNLV